MKILTPNPKIALRETGTLLSHPKIVLPDGTREGWRIWSESLASIYRERWSPFVTEDLRKSIPDPGAGRHRGLILTSDLHWLTKVARVRWALETIWKWHLESYLEQGPYSGRDEHFVWLFQPAWSTLWPDKSDDDCAPNRATWEVWEGDMIQPSHVQPHLRRGRQVQWYRSGSLWLVGIEQFPHIHEEGLIVEVHWNEDLRRYRACLG